MPKLRLRKKADSLPYTEIVRHLYRGLLGREPDEKGLHNWTEVAKEHGLDHVVRSIVDSKEHSMYFRSRRSTTGSWSMSEGREVELLVSTMISHVVRSRVIVDVGANGLLYSNSIDLIAGLGWSGILIEANPVNAASLAEATNELDATVVNCAVDVTEGEATLYLGRSHFLSSLSRDHTAVWGEVKGEIAVKARRLGGILDEHGVPHDFGVLSLDIEGHDIAVLNDLITSTRYRPLWIIVEWGPDSLNPSMDDDRLCAELRHEYSIVGSTFSNVVLQHMSVATPA